jgi:pimeloyl-ACP methyl ester carboxylesterase
VLQIHGEHDGCVLPRWARESSRWAGGRSRLEMLPGVGHYPHLEAPDAVSELLVEWLA